MKEDKVEKKSYEAPGVESNEPLDHVSTYTYYYTYYYYYYYWSVADSFDRINVGNLLAFDALLCRATGCSYKGIGLVGAGEQF